MAGTEVRERVVEWINNIPIQNEVQESHRDDSSSIISTRSTPSDPGDDIQEQESFTPIVMGLQREAATSDGVVVARNASHKIKVKEIQEHLLIPEYPATAAEGILHFIHDCNPFPSSRNPNDFSEEEINNIFTRLMSKIQFAKTIQGLQSSSKWIF
ncbi:uncharacterized protein ATNIH1004_002923 [Aspergillus tanneri]|uniref:Uncharacterized protein n=1 Tax=Aspergillus tanneri TaxID=1220188 RepID=A0A5M9MSX5_9EURO|nr:uncharacterized protein ATNIH1004_009467 [Aspergillus tanneri]XP_033429602.1 uncharacterized protein ATNIH1004_002923 [Aspergillus tanneri]KAA8642715.1 hypothetical protein ATNIH1004_009467 [Aspergillus tanneri]KAA8650241.1 hypothetical protein ATNIH1004_002923 [Aspergillus tanneri]